MSEQDESLIGQLIDHINYLTDGAGDCQKCGVGIMKLLGITGSSMFRIGENTLNEKPILSSFKENTHIEYLVLWCDHCFITESYLLRGIYESLSETREEEELRKLGNVIRFDKS